MDFTFTLQAISFLAVTVLVVALWYILDLNVRYHKCLHEKFVLERQAQKLRRGMQ